MTIAIWAFTVIFACAGTALTLWRARTRNVQEQECSEGVTILKPLCGHDSGLEENLRSFFLLEHPRFELIFSVADPTDPAVSLVKRLRGRYPLVRSKLIIGAESAGPNPKVNNLLRSYQEASFDQILISDSNVRVEPDYIQKVTAELTPEVGVVTAVVAGVEARGWGGRLEATYLNTFYARGMNLAFATGNPCVIGKSMLFRKSVAENFGGLRGLAGYLAEDYALGEEMRRMGLQVVLMRQPIRQYIGDYSFRTFWQRHIRWGRIRKAHAPWAFILEPVFMPLVASAIASTALASTFGFFPAFLGNLSVWMGCDLILMRKLGGRLETRSPVDWLAREAIALPLWLAAGSGNSVNWRGNRITLLSGGKIREEKGEECSNLSFGERQPVPTRWRATIQPATGGAGSTTAI